MATGATAAFVAAAGSLGAQGTTFAESWVGSETELYLRALAANGMLAPQPWSARPFAPAVLARWASDSATTHPWRAQLRSARPDRGFALLAPSASFSFNSAFPWGSNDGAVWQGKGANAWATVGVAVHAGPLSMRFEPVAFFAQNTAFPLLPAPAGNPFADAFTPGSIDLPQRFGSKSYSRVDPGQSFVRLDVHGATIGVSTENIAWGPGVRNTLLFGANAAGFPHLFAGTSEAVRTPLGRFHGQVIYGQLAQSSWAPGRHGNGMRFGSGVIVSWMPPSGRGVELGVARFFHRDWQNIGLDAWRSPFSALFGDAQVAGTGAADNQLASAFARLVAERAGFEAWAEFGKNDHNSNLRDAALEPEHNSAFSLGFLKTLGDVRAAKFWSVRAEYLDARVTPLQRFRGQSTFYDHSPITEGHTQLGQLLGSPLIERSAGLEIAADRWSARGRTGLTLTQRSMPATLQEGEESGAARSQWALELSATRFRGSFDVTARAGAVLDLNRTPGNDVTSLFAGVSLRGPR